MATPADTAQFTRSEWATADSGEWSGDCPKLVYVAWRAAGVIVPKGNAIANYRSWTATRGALPMSAPARGAIVFYDIARPYGHTAVALGNGYVMTTVGMDWDNRSNEVRRYDSFAKYLGWVLPA